MGRFSILLNLESSKTLEILSLNFKFLLDRFHAKLFNTLEKQDESQ